MSFNYGLRPIKTQKISSSGSSSELSNESSNKVNN